jgi:hypothetical protein
VTRAARMLVAAVLAAGVIHAIAGCALAEVDPIAALLGHHAGVGGVVVLAAAALAAARLFLIVVAPACAVHHLAKAIARAIYMPPK